MFLKTFLNLLNIRSDALPGACISELPTLFISNTTNTERLHTCTGKKKIFSFDFSLKYATTSSNFYAVILKHFGTGNEKIFLRRFVKKTGENIVISSAYLKRHGFDLEILNEFMDPNFEVFDHGIINVSIYRSIDFSMKTSDKLIKDAILSFKKLLGLSENLNSVDVVFQIAIQTSHSDMKSTMQFVHSNEFHILFNKNSSIIY